MARPIKETPILFGEEARKFEKEAQNVRPLSKEEKERIRRDYEYVKSRFKTTKNERATV